MDTCLAMARRTQNKKDWWWALIHKLVTIAQDKGRDWRIGRQSLDPGWESQRNTQGKHETIYDYILHSMAQSSRRGVSELDI